jgi:hypothetical protein
MESSFLADRFPEDVGVADWKEEAVRIEIKVSPSVNSLAPMIIMMKL